jgi:hypothetical protein
MKSYGGTTADWYPQEKTRRPSFWLAAVVFAFCGAVGWCFVNYSTYGSILPSWQDKMIVQWEDRYGPITDDREVFLLAAVNWTCNAYERGYTFTQVWQGHLANGFTDHESATIQAGATVLLCPQFEHKVTE